MSYIVGIKIIFSNTFELCIFVLYIPPNFSFENYQYFLSLFQSESWIADQNVLLLGDFNVPFYNSEPTDSKALMLKNFEEFCNLTQYNSIINVNNRLLDLVLANVNCNVERCDSPLVPEDVQHPTLHIIVECGFTAIHRFPDNQSDSLAFNFRKANYPLMYDLLCKVDWTSIYETDNIDKACGIFYDILQNIFNICVPKYTSIKRKRSYPPWFDNNIIKCIRDKYTAHKNFKKLRSTYYYEKFKDLRNLCKSLINTAYQKYILDMQNNIFQDPKKLWSFVNSKRETTRIHLDK